MNLAWTASPPDVLGNEGPIVLRDPFIGVVAKETYPVDRNATKRPQTPTTKHSSRS